MLTIVEARPTQPPREVAPFQHSAEAYHALADRILAGGALEFYEARALLDTPSALVPALLAAAGRVREAQFGRDVHLHVLQNAKKATCPEDCTFCSQSTRYNSKVERTSMMGVDKLFEGARKAWELGAKRYCMVTATRGPTTSEAHTVAEATRRIKAELPGLEVCASLGRLDAAKARILAEAGVDRFNHNLETSERHYPNVVSTHTWQDRVETVRIAKAAGMEACCGGIIGLGEMLDDRVALAFALRDLSVESVPVNFLDPRPGTPMEHVERPDPDDCLRVLAMFRMVHPKADVRMAGGRELALGERQAEGLQAANSLFVNGYLTTGGQGYEADVALIEGAGYRVASIHAHDGGHGHPEDAPAEA